MGLGNWEITDYSNAVKPNEDLRQIMVYNLSSSNIPKTKIAFIGSDSGVFRNHYYDVNKPNEGPNTLEDNYYNCMLVQYRKNQIAYKSNAIIKINDLFNFPKQQSYKNQDGVHITITPFHAPGKHTTCSEYSTNHQLKADYYDIYVININKLKKSLDLSNKNKCIITGNDYSRCPNYENTHIEFMSDKDRLRLVGPLYNWFRSINQSNPIHIRVNPSNKPSNALLNADVFSFYFKPDSMKTECRDFINNHNNYKHNNHINTVEENINYFQELRNNCSDLQLMYGPNDLESQSFDQFNFNHKDVPSYTTNHQVIIDGQGILSSNPFKITNLQSRSFCTHKTTNIDECKDYGISQLGLAFITDQVVISSNFDGSGQHQPSFKRDENDLKKNASIILKNITVVGGARKNTSNIRLNYHASWNNYEAEKKGDINNSNDYPVYMHDVTQVGNWLDQADAASIEGRYSHAENNFFHVADDALKTMADGVKFNNTTIIDGAAGSPIMLGQYGYNRGQNNVSITDTYIVRMNQKNFSDEWSENEGIISTHATGWGSIGNNCGAGNACFGLEDYNSDNADYSDKKNKYEHIKYKHINITNVYKLTTPEDYSHCKKPYSLTYPRMDQFLTSNNTLDIYDSGFEDIVLERVIDDQQNLCFETGVIDANDNGVKINPKQP